ncbi:MAG TPA: hypothetical protein VFH52_09745 [Rhodanobacteraceae bacterium]|nr:hypothetical protein [Rhodanobacteraceae bacterium]
MHTNDSRQASNALHRILMDGSASEGAIVARPRAKRDPGLSVIVIGRVPKSSRALPLAIAGVPPCIINAGIGCTAKIFSHAISNYRLRRGIQKDDGESSASPSAEGQWFPAIRPHKEDPLRSWRKSS